MIKRLDFCIYVALYFFLCPESIFAQSIAIDGRFDDWGKMPCTYTSDPVADGSGLDFTALYITNDETNLYIRIEVNDSTNISDSNNVYLNIDGDNNSSTGYSTNGIGAELGWRLGYRYGFYYHGSYKDTIYAGQLGIVGLPTYKSKIFEIAISRNALLATGVKLFTSDTIRLNFSNGVQQGDMMPDYGKKIIYIFNNTSRSGFSPLNIDKCNPAYIRLMSYNVLYDGLKDTARIRSFERIFKAINPDIIILNECTNTTYTQAKLLLDSWLPISTGWTCYKVDPGNIICSRFPVLYAKNISFRKATFAFIDLPTGYQSDLVVIGTHLYPGGDGDTVRQRESDVIAAFIRDMKAGTTAYNVPVNTPFLIAGDFNMVNSFNPLNTLLTGNIVNTSLYGTAGPPDWNNMPLASAPAYIADRNMAYTWRNQSATNKSWPGKLDYILYSSSCITVKKCFVLQSEQMNTSRLTQYGLNATDNLIASDHLPIVADLQISYSPASYQALQWNGQADTTWENPLNWNCNILPDKWSDVIIPAGVPHFPYISTDTEIHSIHLNNSSYLQVKPGVKFILNGK